MTLSEVTDLLGLAQPGRRVLVVEDHLPLLLRLREFWTEAGHSVVAWAGVDEIEGPMAKGWESDLKTLATLDLRTVEVAFLDHYFLSSRFNGASLTRELLMHGTPKILGMSSDAGANTSMLKEGAVGAVRKAELMRLFYSG